jgi:hypothetical protein
LIVEAGLTIELFTTIMPRGELGILRWVNSAHLNQALGPGVEAMLRRLKDRAGFGQYSLVIAHKDHS